jgi:hypothetical protein
MPRNDFSGSVAQAVILFVILGLSLAALAFFAMAFVVVLFIAAIIYGALWYYRYTQEQKRLADAKDRQAEELRLLTQIANKPFPTADDWLSRFYDELFPVDTTLPENIAEQILVTAHHIYTTEVPKPLPSDADKDTIEAAALLASKFDPDLLLKVTVSAFNSLVHKIPVIESGQFTLPLAELVHLPSAIHDLIMPFRDETLYETKLSWQYTWKPFHENAVKLGGGNTPVYPQDFKSDLSNTKIAHLYLRNTIFDELFQLPLPFGFDDDTRFTHHWCMGDNGTGKTTYLRHFIKPDLIRVAKGECSLLVLDSKKLIREMRTLRVFAEDLRDRVIIVDPKHPVALNPFYLPENECADIVSYMLGDIEGAASKLQRGAISYLVKAARTRPNPSLNVLRDFFALKKSRADRMEEPEGFNNFDPNTQHWFRSVFPNLHQATREGVHQRLMNLIDNEFMERSLNADRCAVNLFDELHEGGKVLLVDTDRGTLGKENTHVLGRLFIAFVDQLSSRRTHLPEKTLKPIFVVIDEAHDYIQNDERFADILEKARAQHIAITVAHHHEGQIDTRIQASLRNAGIKAHCGDRGSVSVKTRRRDYTVPIEPLDFDHEDQMDRVQYADMRQRIDAKYGVRAPSGSPGPLSDRFDEP